MGGMSWIHWVLVAGVATLVFGGSRIPNVMGDFAKGVRAFREGLKDEPADEAKASAIDRS